MSEQEPPTDAAATDEEPPGTRNTAMPWPPRVYDFLTGGSEHFTADKVFGRQIAEQVPWVQRSMWINKVHRTKAALVLAEELGITQVIDLGCGYPSCWGTMGGSGVQEGCEHIPPHTFDVVEAVHKAHARVVYADNDGYVYGHAKTQLDEFRGTSAVKADARDIPALLTDHGVIEHLDLDRPVGVILHDVLPWLTGDEAALTLRSLHELLPLGSAVSITHATGDDDPTTMSTLAGAYAEKGLDYRPRSRAAIEELLGPWELLPPGLRPTGRWREGEPPHIPRHLRTTWNLPADASHAYAAVTAPKTTRPEPTTVTGLLAREPARAPGLLLVGATLKALREHQGVALPAAAGRMSVPPLALGLWESGSHRLDGRIRRVLEAVSLDDYPAQRLLERLLPSAEGMWSSGLPWEREEFSDPYPGNTDRANAALRASTGVRTFALDRIPEAFQTAEYASLFPRGHLIGPVTGSLPPIAAPQAQDTDSRTWELVLDECLLERHYGRPEVMAGQLDHLLFLDTLPHVTVRVLRLDTPFAMPVASITEHTLTGGTLWRLNGFAYRGLSRGDACRLMLDRALDHSESETMSRTLLEQARGKALSTVESTIGAPSAPTEEASDA
ncbi:Scr1 family TA system antitoxin-like transcriptional regulator [Streptomyces sp. NBC_01237]|uniref:Scr1 family TA system antitoxin-like transcriptional regulator n=1 Tax=Streptomyces sp. NBC_01237 TaxID=2903790 RepID=UPI002DD9C3EB|nr:Scr1 family TA system antitoxin-like transcriptional regulator [Streptomyces sp. NBC_01237]WRZ77197.1 Scr1 family TA system antitoxin-like transcriptional regulator [Streptomyces sp. NBC_01237]